MALLEVNGLSKTFGQGELTVQALSDINLQVEEGEFVALVGPSGSGKTTLLNIIGGLDTPTHGHVSISGVETTGLAESALSDFRLFNIGFVFQAYNLVPVLSAKENVELIMTMQGAQPEERAHRAEAILKTVGLDKQQHRRPAQLSGGQQQRVAVARVLASQPKIVLADEPTANLDSENAANLLNVMKTLSEEEKTTFIFSTHDVRVMEKARRIVTLRDGRIVSDERQD